MERTAWEELREELLEAPYRIIDIFPRQVSAERGARYFAVERCLLEHPRIDGLYRRFARLVLKLNCYHDAALYDPQTGVWQDEPWPEELAGRIEGCAAAEGAGYVHILFPAERALLTLDPGDLYMTLYGPAEGLLHTLRQLAAAEGLFVREPETDAPAK